MNRVIVEDHLQEYVRRHEVLLDKALGRMAGDIKIIAKIRVPFKSGDLMRAIRDEKRGSLKYRVIADKEYAGYQERGARADGSRVVRKYTTPNTGKDYLLGAGLKVSRNAINYIKQAIHS